jgi:hypothetical protein
MAGRNRNQIETVTLTISTTPGVVRYLQDLVATNLYGKNATEAAERVLARTLEDMLAAGRLSTRRRNNGRAEK